MQKTLVFAFNIAAWCCSCPEKNKEMKGQKQGERKEKIFVYKIFYA